MNDSIYYAPGAGCAVRCPQIYSPVCGGDGQTHPSRCHLQEAACLKGSTITVKYEGACKPGDTVPQPQPVEAEQEEEECPEFCIFSYEPVCGTGRLHFTILCYWFSQLFRWRDVQ